jgi:PKD repeat protein
MLAIANVAPAITIASVAGGRPFTPTGIAVPITATFTNPGTLDTHTATVAWGDGTTTSLGAVVRTGVAVSHAYGGAGTFTGTLTVTDKDGGVRSKTFTVEVLAPADAAARLAGLLKPLLPGASPAATKSLKVAINELGSNNGGTASNGATALLRSGARSAALVKLGNAEIALRTVTKPDVSVVRLIIVQVAESVAEDAARSARAAVGCADPVSATCTNDERSSLAKIDGFVATGVTAVNEGRYPAAITSFADATQRAVGLGG